MGNMDEKIEMLKSMIKNSIKKGMWHLLKSPYTWAFIGVLLLIILIMLVLIGASTSASAEGINGTTENFTNASSSSWEQYKAYLAEKEGGTKTEDGLYYIVENDWAGNPTVGIGLCLKSKDGYLHVNQFAAHGVDSKVLADNWLAGDRTGKIEVEICDAILEEDLQGRLNDVKSLVSADLREYQYYALLDVKYRRGNINGFNAKYDALWTEEDNDKYYGKSTASESYSEDTLYSFFWNGGHELEGVRERKKEQWLLFKYGYYKVLGEYWKESYSTGTSNGGNKNQIEGINLYNEDGSVNESSISTLEQQISNYLGRQPINIGGQLSYQVKTEYSNFWSNGGYNYQCAWYAQGRANQYLSYIGSNKRSPTGNGNQMYGDGRDKGFIVNQEKPRANSLICWGAKIGNPCGHVAYVEAVDSDGSIWISHCGGGHAWYGISHLTRDVYSYYTGMPLQGFVYLD